MSVSGSFLSERWRLRRREMEESPWRHTARGRRRSGGLSELLSFAEPLVKRLPVYDRGTRNALDVRLRTLSFAFPDLPPAFEGFTILHLSDLHAGTLPGLIDRVGELVAEVPVDLAVATGDFQHKGTPSAATTAALLAPIVQRVRSRLGILAVLGNHDRSDMADALAALGIRVLVNDHLAIARGEEQLHITGTDDVHRFCTEDALQAIRHGPDGFRILLVHSPEVVHAAADAGVRLYLSGHTHGGQICLPGGVPLVTACDGGRRFARDAWRLGGLQGYTTSGAGVGKPPLRFFSRGEVVHITLRRGKA